MFITFEGIDGCGKTTQALKLKDYLTKAGENVIFTREPCREGPICKDIGEMLLKDYKENMSQLTELFLFEAARAQHIKDVVQPALSDGKIVICDRFTDSTVAYQGYGRGISVDIVNKINNIATNGLTPDIVFFIDIPVEVAMKRSHQVEDTVRDNESKEFYTNCRKYFLEMCENHKNYIRIDAGIKNADEVFELIAKYLKKGEKT